MKQAAGFREKGWTITSENYRDYIDQLVRQCKNKIDKLGITAYNVGEISQYAQAQYWIGRFDEVEAEIMVKRRG